MSQAGPGAVVDPGRRGWIGVSPVAVAWAEDRARQANVRVRLHCGDVFARGDGPVSGPYDLGYDSGCFHHLPPHRRISHLDLLDRALRPGGWFALTCFAAGAMGCELSDAEVYRSGRLHGGLAYTAESLRSIFAPLTAVELRRMYAEPADSPRFGADFLWTALFRRDPESLGDPESCGGGAARSGRVVAC